MEFTNSDNEFILRMRISKHFCTVLSYFISMSDKEECIFCKIIQGEIPAAVIFEDELCLAFMDIYPVSMGHCLLIPKQHFTNLFDVDLEVVSYLAKRLAELARKVNSVIKPDGILTAAANGSGAGQDVPHLHFHVIPRNHGDEFGFRFPEGYRTEMAPRDELEELAKSIRETS
jgi:histidine triad (HIT) family protein